MGQIVINGLSLGALYATLALGFWVIFAVTRTFHLAHVTVLNVSAYALYAVMSSGHSAWLGVAAAAGTAMALGVVIETFVYQPIRRSGGEHLLLFVAASAVLIIGQAALALGFAEDARGIEKDVPPPLFRASTFVITRYDGLNVVSAIALGVLVWLLLDRIPWGRSMRAVQNNAELAGYFGIRVARVYRMSFALGSLLLVPVVFTLAVRNGVSPQLGFTPVLIAIISVIAGGTENQFGAMLAAFFFGLLQNLVLLWVNAEWQEMFVFALLFVMLLLRPSGLQAAVRTRAA